MNEEHRLIGPDGLGWYTKQALSWAVAGYAIRKLAMEVEILELHPHFAGYDCLTIYGPSRDKQLMLNRNGSSALGPDGLDTDIWMQALSAPERLGQELVSSWEKVGDREIGPNARLANLCMIFADWAAVNIRHHPTIEWGWFDGDDDSGSQLEKIIDSELPSHWRTGYQGNYGRDWRSLVWVRKLDGKLEDATHFGLFESIRGSGKVANVVENVQVEKSFNLMYRIQAFRGTHSAFDGEVPPASVRGISRTLSAELMKVEITAMTSFDDVETASTLWRYADPLTTDQASESIADDLGALALDIARCPEVRKAADDTTHPCHRVVTQQTSFRHLSSCHTPEPWFGNLQNALVVGLASNPGLSKSDAMDGEEFPTSEWEDSAIKDFFMNRLTSSHGPFVTFNFAGERNFLTRSRDGKYRSAHSNPKTPQKTWVAIHNRMLEILGDSADPSGNYALTEIVHCKSEKAIGVKQASSLCSDLWLDKKFARTNANVVLLLGKHARDEFLKLRQVPNSNYGNGTNYNSLSPAQRAMRDIVIENLGGKNRIVVFNFHNGASMEQILDAVYGPEVVAWLGKVAHDHVPVPGNTDELRLILKQLLAG